VLDRGLNDRIRSVAETYHAEVVDLFPAFAINANTLVSSDCVHPSGAGYQVIATLSNAAIVAAQ
jgi:lysophospholipase L1-like esterase